MLDHFFILRNEVILVQQRENRWLIMIVLNCFFCKTPLLYKYVKVHTRNEKKKKKKNKMNPAKLMVFNDDAQRK